MHGQSTNEGMNQMRITKYIVLLALFALGKTALACTAGTPIVTTVNLPATLTVARDSATGSILYDSGWTGGSARGSTYCSGGEIWTYGYVSPMIATGIAHVYQTGVPGVGIKAVWSNNPNYLPSDINTVNPSMGTMWMEWPRTNGGALSAVQYIPGAQYRIQFIKTGTLGSGTMTLPNPTVNSMYGSSQMTSTTFTNSSINVQVSGCTVTQNNITVLLNKIKTSDLSAIGSTVAPSAFNIPLTCDPGINVAYEIDGTPDASNAPGVLANQTGSGMATGVGVQVLQGSNPITLGTLSAIYITTTTSAQQVNIPMTARYYKSNATVTAGNVSSTATFTMNYQ